VKKVFIRGTLVLFLATALVPILSLSQAAVAPAYPQYRLTPASPTTADSVSFWLVKGKSNMTCYPRYATSTGGTITTVIWPGGGESRTGTIYLKYQELMLGIACAPMADSVEYGPKINIGKLQAGTYIIYDSITNTTLDTFYVITPALKDSVTFTPASPTTKDSLDFSLFGASLGCGGTVHDDTVLVEDTCIYLSFSYEECLACDCTRMGRWIPFQTSPLKAGTYGIYKAQQIYCAPNTPCPAIALMPVRVGQVTVHSTTAVVPFQATMSKSTALTFERISNAFRLSIPYAQSVSLELYALDGRKIATIFNAQIFNAGTYRLMINKFTNVSGCVIAKLKTANGVTVVPVSIVR
jgi:hypothetical protein